ncbi:MAG: DUF4396 domain-containing protein [Plesiomonas sp.]|uniref:DUF4396 domain-containing protein n=1 Tax=Plesiomonas sp. TaxID=2486279 RepID=UPI003EE65845
MIFPEWLHTLAVIWLISALLCAITIYWDIHSDRAQSMKVMAIAWPINALYFGIIGLIAYFWFGRAPKGGQKMMMHNMHMEHMSHDNTATAMNHDMHMEHMSHDNTTTAMNHDMHMEHMSHDNTTTAMNHDMHMEHMPHDNTTTAMNHDTQMEHMPHKKITWKGVFTVSTHCGIGCTLADIAGEWITFFIPISLAGSYIVGGWVFDFILALIFGIYFQYMPAREMGMSPSAAFKNAIKADFLSLTCWQIGMYIWMSIVLFGIFTPDMPHNSAVYWFMMQIAMMVGFCTAYPMNWWLTKIGIKHTM